MVKFGFAILCVCIAGVIAEPPSGYRPPQARNSPSSQYGVPQQQSGGYQRSSGFGGQNGRSRSYNSIAENQFSGASRSSSQGRNAVGSRSQPSQSYGAPSYDDSVTVGAARSSQGPRNSFSAPRFGGQAASRFSAPAPQYNAPAPRQQQSSYASAARQQPSAQYGAPAPVYGAPSSKSNNDDDLAEPANYEYNYEVNAAEESGPEFGHQETREDDFAQGEYHVLLPDGRMQIVEYEADEEGFRPKIRYEETGYPDARDNQGPY